MDHHKVGQEDTEDDELDQADDHARESGRTSGVDGRDHGRQAHANAAEEAEQFTKVIGKEDEADIKFHPQSVTSVGGRGASAVARAPTPGKRTPIQNRGLAYDRSGRRGYRRRWYRRSYRMAAMATIMPCEDRACKLFFRTGNDRCVKVEEQAAERVTMALE